MEIESHCTGRCFQICSNPNPPLNEIVLEELGSFTVTALSVAICEANLPMVKRIFKIWGADIHATVQQSLTDDETTRTVTFQGVTPLFIAALNKNPKIVRYLIKKGADVSVGTSDESEDYWSTGMTPLHAAFFLINSTSSKSSKQLKTIRCLVEAGADPSALSSKGIPVWMMSWAELCMSFTQPVSILGRSFLHHLAGPANTGNVKVVELLLKKGADISAQDNDGLTPIMVAAIGNNEVPNMIIFKYLLEIDEIPNIEKIKALEVAAAVLLSYKENVHHIKDALTFLARARSLRQRENYFIDLQEPLNGLPAEWITKRIYNYHEIQWRYSEFLMQSVLIRIRVFSSISYSAVIRYVFPCIGKYIETLIQQNQFTSATQYLAVLVEMLQHLHDKKDPLFNTEILINSLNLMSTKFDHIDGNSYNKTLHELAKLFVGLPVYILSEQVIDCLDRIVNHNGKNRCEGTMAYMISTASTEELLPIIGFLLRLGLDANSVESNGNGALHNLARSWKKDEEIEPIARVLIHAGARLDRVNNQGQTAAKIWHEKTRKEKVSSSLLVCFLQFIRLWPVEWIYCALPNWLIDEGFSKPECLTRLKGGDVLNLPR